MARKGIIFTDIDGTLVFQEKFHGVRGFGINPDGTTLVEDPATGHRTSAWDISVPPVTRFLAESTRRLCHRLRADYFIFLVTGSTIGTLRATLQHLDFADGYILEHGGMILDSEFRVDPEWAAVIEPYRAGVACIRADIETAGWNFLLDRDRCLSVQLRLIENPGRTPAEFEHLCSRFQIPEGFKRTSNLGDFTILPCVSGKGAAVGHYLKSHPEIAMDSVAMGDDINDLDFLRVCRRVYVPASALPEVLEEARHRGWYVSSGLHFHGVDENLRAILDDRK